MFVCCRDNEKAILKVNGKQCWTKTFTGVQGKQICGSQSKNWNELKVRATCKAAAVKGQLTVQVTTTLNSGAGDESFAIDNAVLTKVTAPAPVACKAPKYINKAKKCVACPKGSTCDGKTATACKAPKVVTNNKCVTAPFKTIRSNFANAKDLQGWNCGKVQKCGSIGNVCGGYGTKGAKHDIKKTFTKLPSGKYTISLDFIKIDSWYAWHVFVVGKHVNLSFAENTSAFT